MKKLQPGGAILCSAVLPHISMHVIVHRLIALSIRQRLVGLFPNRNPRISLRKPESTRIGGIISLNHDTEKQYFDSLMLVMEKQKLVESKMFNVDGIKMSTFQKPTNTLGLKGQKQGNAVI